MLRALSNMWQYSSSGDLGLLSMSTAVPLLLLLLVGSRQVRLCLAEYTVHADGLDIVSSCSNTACAAAALHEAQHESCRCAHLTFTCLRIIIPLPGSTFSSVCDLSEVVRKALMLPTTSAQHVGRLKLMPASNGGAGVLQARPAGPNHWLAK